MMALLMLLPLLALALPLALVVGADVIAALPALKVNNIRLSFSKDEPQIIDDVLSDKTDCGSRHWLSLTVAAIPAVGADVS